MHNFFKNLLDTILGAIKHYIQFLHTQKASVSKQLEILKLFLPNSYEPVIMHTFKQQANPQRADDRYECIF